MFGYLFEVGKKIFYGRCIGNKPEKANLLYDKYGLYIFMRIKLNLIRIKLKKELKPHEASYNSFDVGEPWFVLNYFFSAAEALTKSCSCVR